MDFNSIFGRPSSGRGALSDTKDPEQPLDEWSTFLDEILPVVKPGALSRARLVSMRRRLEDRAQNASYVIADSRGTIYEQSNMLDKRHALALISEIDQRLATAWSGESVSSDNLNALTHFLDDVRETYNISLFSLFQPVAEAEERLRGKQYTPQQKKISADSVYFVYKNFERDFPKMKQRYESLKRQIKGRLPLRFHGPVDQIVELFVYEPYETGLLYIRRHLPGTVGAFHGLEEEE
jgi:hypothetical protein